MFDQPDYVSGELVGNGDVRGVSYGNDKGLFVEFRKEPVYNEFQSLSSGRAVYDERIFVKIYVPGDKTKVIDRLAYLEDQNGVPADPKRWPVQWAAFKNGEKAEMQGTPLSQWPRITRQQATEFAAMQIHTVEQLSEVSDVALDGLGHGGRAIRDAAIEYLDRAKDENFVARLQQQHAQQLEAMQARMAEMEARMNDEPKRGPGRPKKEEAHDLQS